MPPCLCRSWKDSSSRSQHTYLLIRPSSLVLVWKVNWDHARCARSSSAEQGKHDISVTQDRMLKCYAASLGISRDFGSISLKWNQRFRIGKKLQESLTGEHSMTSCQCDKRESHIAVNYKRVPV